MPEPDKATPDPVPAPVVVANPDPIPVTPIVPEETTAQRTARRAASSARVDADILRTEDQRRISGIWERTQQVIALSVVEVTLLVVSLLVLTPSYTTAAGKPVAETATTASVAGMIFLASVANLVIGFYFGRTNHQRVGGVSADEVGGR